ncbi:hypothetical protein KP77_17730 [Jeotgalibacillus alimentarius]|uniref:Uncharacterized protein n=1 Tax=Jeotgalibacillus alimentarius TaxID=135826 RepID=A0A0C2W2T3_9BACL|nr:hypothetical protein KP77_17730 [Jeotgalibacillus alimentarius]
MHLYDSSTMMGTVFCDDPSSANRGWCQPGTESLEKITPEFSD